MKKDIFTPGQKVRITNDTYFHGLEKGEIVTLVKRGKKKRVWNVSNDIFSQNIFVPERDFKRLGKRTPTLSVILLIVAIPLIISLYVSFSVKVAAILLGLGVVHFINLKFNMRRDHDEKVAELFCESSKIKK